MKISISDKIRFVCQWYLCQIWLQEGNRMGRGRLGGRGKCGGRHRGLQWCDWYVWSVMYTCIYMGEDIASKPRKRVKSKKLLNRCIDIYWTGTSNHRKQLCCSYYYKYYYYDTKIRILHSLPDWCCFSFKNNLSALSCQDLLHFNGCLALLWENLSK